MKKSKLRFAAIFVTMALFTMFWFIFQPFAGSSKEYTNSIGMEFVLIPAGSFMMGTEENIKEALRTEKPRHSVDISKPFYMAKYEVTQEQWVALMENNPSNIKAPKNPVESVEWEDVQTFIRKLNSKEGTQKYRLPTEAEWEYAARAGSAGKYCFGDDEARLSQYAWYDGNSGDKTHPVGQLKPNAWGLYDMHGNVWEWVKDFFDSKYYSNSPPTDPTGPSSGSYRVLRGGSYYNLAWQCRSAFRAIMTQPALPYTSGFRLAISQGQ